MGKKVLKVIETESLADYFTRLGKLYTSGKLDRIHSSKNLKCPVVERSSGFEVSSIPVDFTIINRFYLKSIEAGFASPSHKHESPTFRYIIKGSIIINNVRYSAGDWVLVPRGVNYTVRVDEDLHMMYACDHG